MTASTGVREKFDELAPGYDRKVAIAEWLLLRRDRRYLLSRARGEVLEIAIGTGRNLPFYPSSCRVTGIDLSWRMLAEAKKRARRHGLEVRLLEMDLEELGFRDRTFDTAVVTLSLCAASNPNRGLSEIRRVLHPDGILLMMEHVRSRNRWLGRLQDRGADKHRARHGCYPNRRTLEMTLAAGFTAEEGRTRLLGSLLRAMFRPAT